MSIDFFPTPEPLVRATLAYISEQYYRYSHPLYILDIGCGDGIYCRIAKEFFPKAHTTGFDIIDRNPVGVDDFRNYDYYHKSKSTNSDILYENDLNTLIFPQANSVSPLHPI